MLKTILQYNDYISDIAYMHDNENFYKIDTKLLEINRLYSDMGGYSGDIINELSDAINNNTKIIVQDKIQLIPLLAFDYAEIENKPQIKDVQNVLKYFNISTFEFYSMVDNMS